MKDVKDLTEKMKNLTIKQAIKKKNKIPKLTKTIKVGKSCSINNDCVRGRICHPVDKRCVKRGESGSIPVKDVLLQESRRKKTNLQSGWKYKQGTDEIIIEAQMKVRNVENNIDCKFDGRTQWYQNIVKTFMSPISTVERLLIAHQLGTGKTRSMLEIISNFYNDKRPIIVIVPKQSLVNNFYDELFKHPTRLRKFLYSCLGKPPEPMTNSFRERCIELLEKKGKIRNGQVFSVSCSNSPAAPIRCVRMTQAGSSGFARNPIFKVSNRISSESKVNGESIFDSCIVMVDEGHLLVQDSAWEGSQKRNIRSLSESLTKSQNCKLALLTATPVVNSKDDAIRLMKIVQASSTEKILPGYVSWFMSRVGNVFATTQPEGVLPQIIEVPLEGKNLEEYKKKVLKIKEGTSKVTNGLYTSEHMATAKPSGYKALLNSGLQGAEIATKLNKIADDVKSSKKKTCIMIHKSNGLMMLYELMIKKGIKVKFCSAASSNENAKEVASKNASKINDFNGEDNILGQKIQALILDSSEFSEGVSLRNVKAIILADLGDGIKPVSWGRVKQRIGRALRFCSHVGLPPSERILEVYLYIATFNGILVSDKQRRGVMRDVRKEMKQEIRERKKLLNEWKRTKDIERAKTIESILGVDLSELQFESKNKLIEVLKEKVVLDDKDERFKNVLEARSKRIIEGLAGIDDWKTLDQKKYSDLKKQVREVEKANCQLAETALDRGVYGDVGCAFISK